MKVLFQSRTYFLILFSVATVFLTGFDSAYRRPKIKGYKIQQIVLVKFGHELSYRGRRSRPVLPSLYVELTRNHNRLAISNHLKNCVPQSRHSFFKGGFPCKVKNMRDAIGLTFRYHNSKGGTAKHTPMSPTFYFSGVELLSKCSAQKKSKSIIVYETEEMEFEIHVQWL